MKCVPQGNVWRRHLDQIRQRYGIEDVDPGYSPRCPEMTPTSDSGGNELKPFLPKRNPGRPRKKIQFQNLESDEPRVLPRRSERIRQKHLMARGEVLC